MTNCWQNFIDWSFPYFKHTRTLLTRLSTTTTFRYVLKDVQAVTGLPLLNGKEITPLAWVITLSIQLMPLGEN